MKQLINHLPTTENLWASPYDQATSNCPELGICGVRAQDRRELKDWSDPNWEILRFPGNHILVMANRPNKAEVRDGDLHGHLGTTVRLAQVSKLTIKNALRIARRVATADARRNCVIPRDWMIGIAEIHSAIKIFTN